MGQQPTCQGKGQRSTTLMQNAHTYLEVLTLNLEGWPYTLHSIQAETTEHEVMLNDGLKPIGGKIKLGGVHKTPKKYPPIDYLHR